MSAVRAAATTATAATAATAATPPELQYYVEEGSRKWTKVETPNWSTFEEEFQKDCDRLKDERVFMECSPDSKRLAIAYNITEAMEPKSKIWVLGVSDVGLKAPKSGKKLLQCKCTGRTVQRIAWLPLPNSGHHLYVLTKKNDVSPYLNYLTLYCVLQSEKNEGTRCHTHKRTYTLILAMTLTLTPHPSRHRSASTVCACIAGANGPFKSYGGSLTTDYDAISPGSGQRPPSP